MAVKKVHADVLAVQGLLIMSAVSVFLLVCRFLSVRDTFYGFMVWNLVLAWVPVVAALGLRNWLRTHPWKSWQGILIATACVAFLPNSFYLVTDFIHLNRHGTPGLLFDVVMIMSFSITGMLLGCMALYVLHAELLKRMVNYYTWLIVVGIIVASSFAVYLGRYLRWNSWDIIANPFGLLFDVSDSLVNPVLYPSMLTTTLMFSWFIGGVYFGIVRLAAGLRGLSE